MKTVVLVSSDGVCFSVDINAANMCGTIKEMNQFEFDGDKTDQNIPIPNVRGDILSKVLEWANYHKNDSVDPYMDEMRPGATSEWDLNFMKKEEQIIYELTLAANYLDAKKLLQLCCKTIGEMIKPLISDPQSIRAKFNITNDFTEEDEEAVRKENCWSEPPEST